MSHHSPLTTHHSPLRDRCIPIQLLLLDVDGVLTDGRIIYGDDGVELKAFHVRDGAGLTVWQTVGKRAAVITGRTSPVVERRAAELGIGPVFSGVGDKWAVYRHLLTAGPWKPAQVCFVGDDLPDLPVLDHCGLAVAVADACAEVKAAAHYVTQAAGGQGAVRETVEVILRCQGHWPQVVQGYRKAVLGS